MDSIKRFRIILKTPTGEIHYYATPEETPILMAELVQWYNSVRQNVKIHPVVLAAIVHHRFVEIHPFDDGNGRVARMLMNLILIKNKFPSAIIKQDKREEYYAALKQADTKEYESLIEFVAESVLDSMNLYLKAAKGENIEEDADLDKEIALFKMGFCALSMAPIGRPSFERPAGSEIEGAPVALASGVKGV